MQRFNFSFTALEDMHLGTGLGAGLADSLQLKDRNGNPYIPSTHIKGVLRHNAQEILGIDNKTLNYLFGYSGTEGGKLVLTSAWCQNRLFAFKGVADF